MKLLALTLLVPLAASSAPEAPSDTSMPRDAQIQEQYVFLSATVKNLSQAQELIFQQQQLILQHLDELRHELAQLKCERTNAASRKDLELFVSRLDALESQFHSLQTNRSTTTPVMQDLLDKATAQLPVVSTNGAAKLQTYRIQPGDTLLKIIARLNDAADKANAPRITQEQIERANPNLAPDRIRAGQMILIPLPETPAMR